MAACGMAENPKQASTCILVRRENYYGLGVTSSLNILNYIHIGKICLDLGNKRYLLEQCWKVEKNISKAKKKILRRKLQLSCTAGSVAL
jgi:hypothetical protein